MSFFKLKLKSKQLKYEDVAILYFEIVGKNKKDKIEFRAGQYLNLYSAKNSTGRSYTILSQPDEKLIAFAVRVKGEFSTLLYNLKVGETIDADGPHGIFRPADDCENVICIANGIGVVPFINWINSSDFAGASFHFLFSNSTLGRAPFLEQILENKKAKISAQIFITQQKNLKASKIIGRRIQKQDIKKAIAHKKNATIAICGSIEFTRDMWKLSKSLGVSEEQIITEAFF